MTFHQNERLIFTSEEVPASEKVFASTAELCLVNFSLSPLLKIGTMCTKLRRAKRKSAGFGVKRLNDEWRDHYSFTLFYHELDNYFIENER